MFVPAEPSARTAPVTASVPEEAHATRSTAGAFAVPDSRASSAIKCVRWIAGVKIAKDIAFVRIAEVVSRKMDLASANQDGRAPSATTLVQKVGSE